jgi:hypothetical protein
MSSVCIKVLLQSGLVYMSGCDGGPLKMFYSYYTEMKSLRMPGRTDVLGENIMPPTSPLEVGGHKKQYIILLLALFLQAEIFGVTRS